MVGVVLMLEELLVLRRQMTSRVITTKHQLMDYKLKYQDHWGKLGQWDPEIDHKTLQVFLCMIMVEQKPAQET
jgi:hypothetical protein